MNDSVGKTDLQEGFICRASGMMAAAQLSR
jgi:hypothetical protein